MQFSSFRFTSILLLFFFLAHSAYGQQIEPGHVMTLDEEDHAKICILHPTDVSTNFKYVPGQTSRRKGIPNAEQTASFNIDYVNDCEEEVWPEEAKTAFEYAVSIWESHIESPIPIKIEATWAALGENVLGSASPTTLIAGLDEEDTLPNTWYPIAQASAIDETDYATQFDVDYDIVVNMSCEFTNWYFGTDANPPADSYDIVTVLLHEIGHGLGFTGSVSGNPTAQIADWGLSTQNGDNLPFVFDQFTLEGSFRELIDENIFPRQSGELYDALVGQDGGVYFSGTDAEFANDNLRVPLYSPEPFSQGSSYSHLDQQYFSNTPNALMRPQLERGLASHSPGPVTCGIFRDTGWLLAQACIDLLPEAGFLDRPEHASPFNGSDSNSLNPTLAWSFVEGATEYRVQLSENFSFTNLLVDDTVADNSYEVDETLEFNSLYFWRVQAISPSGNSNFSGKFRFRTAQEPPEAILLNIPEDGATQLRPGFNFTWQEQDRAEEYELEIAKNEDFTPLTFNRTLTRVRFGDTQNLEFSTTYYWRVRGVNAAGAGDWSETRSFTTIIEKPESVTLSSPSDDESQVPVNAMFSWQESARAFEYVIQISKDESFPSGELIELTSTEETATVESPLEYATIYYWRVKATNVGGESDFSSPRQFTTVVQETAIMPNYPNPFNGSTTIRFQLSQSSEVTLDVFDTVGRRIVTLVQEERQPGVYFEQIQAAGYASGTYFIRMAAGDFMEVQKMAIIK